MPTARRPKPRVPKIPKASRAYVTRAEFNRVVQVLNERGEIIEELVHSLDIQFKRIAQLQADFDLIKRAWARSKLPRS
jgi:hypothetical protein